MRHVFRYTRIGLVLYTTLCMTIFNCQTLKPYTIRCYRDSLNKGETVSVLYVPDELHIQEIDDVHVPNSVHYAPKKGYRIEFEPGDHTLILYYYRFTNLDDKIGRVMRGNSLCVFFRIETGHVYSLFHSCKWSEDTFDYTIGMEDMVSKEPMLISFFPTEVE